MLTKFTKNYNNSNTNQTKYNFKTLPLNKNLKFINNKSK